MFVVETIIWARQSWEQPKEIFGYEQLKNNEIVCLFDNGM